MTAPINLNLPEGPAWVHTLSVLFSCWVKVSLTLVFLSAAVWFRTLAAVTRRKRNPFR